MTSDARTIGSIAPATPAAAARPLTGPAAEGAARPAPAAVPRAAADDELVGAVPPPDVLAEVEAAAAAADALAEQGLELRYDVRDAHRVRIELVDGEGQVVRRIPPGEALDPEALAERPAADPAADERGGTAWG
ncbi:hypothetical protein [Patulibacter defluvii]|uniref:hypothetical protein n=1 Tax=Patulibacter defluvii TaxID=3095358 RepID=UPI002A75FC94|nr:hypothetical protein [Patulibacter sp. DM4]